MADSQRTPEPTLLHEFDRIRRRVLDFEQRLGGLRQLERKLESAERRFTALLDSVRMFAVGLDGDGLVSYANNYFLEVTGYTLVEVKGVDWLEHFVPESQRPLIEPLLREVLHTGLTPRFEHPIVTREGAERLVVWSGGWNMQELGGPHVRISLGADVTEQRSAEDALRRSEERYRAIVEDQTEVVCRLDGAGKLTFVNAAACELFRAEKGELLGRSFASLWPGSARHEFERVLRVLDRTTPVNTIEVPLERRDLATRWFQCACRLLDAGGHSAREYQIVGHDVTERRRADEARQRATDELGQALERQKVLSEQLEQARSRAEGATAAKSRFLAHMSHEIRTPMNGVLGGVHLMLDSELDATQRETMDIIRSSAESLLSLINEILDFSKIEAGKLELEMMPISIRPLVEDVTAMLAPQTCQKDLELVSLIHADVPARVLGDPARLRQVLTNLAANATKFTDEGEVVIRVFARDAPEGRCAIRFEVSDTGIGIAPERKSRLFQSFSQLDEGAGRGGSGLGLAISKALVELMGGEIGVESRKGKGSTFWFSVPLGRIDRPDPAEEPGNRLKTLAGVEVLVADANGLTRQALVTRLEAIGCRCREASRIDEAERLLTAGRKRRPRLVIVGPKLEDGDGESVADVLRRSPKHRDTRLIMLTPCGLRGDSTRMKQFGFDAYLTKPVRSAQLENCVRRVLDRGHRRDGSFEGPILTRFDVAEERIPRFLLVEDIPVNQKIAARIVERLGFRVDIASNGREALEAVERRRYDLVLMDCRMPVMDGFEATRAIRQLGHPACEVPIVALTADAIKGDRERCIAAGMDEYLSKPIVPEELAAVIERLVRSSEPVAG